MRTFEMKNLLLIVFALLVSKLAMAGDLAFLRGNEIKSFGVRETGPKRLVFGSDWNLKWVKGEGGTRCSELFSHNVSDRCWVEVHVPFAVVVNEYILPEPEMVASQNYRWGDFVATSDLNVWKNSVVPDSYESLMIRIKDVQRGTVYVRDGACVTTELRILANSTTHIASKLWFEDVAAACPR